jgi:hypothetical protein
MMLYFKNIYGAMPIMLSAILFSGLLMAPYSVHAQQEMTPAVEESENVLIVEEAEPDPTLIEEEGGLPDGEDSIIEADSDLVDISEVEDVLDQEPVISTDENLTELEQMMARAALNANIPLPSAIPSLFFTTQELIVLEQARKGLLARPATDDEIEEAEELTFLPPVEPGIREISVGGIIYLNANDWVVWLNGVKVTPDRLPEEIMDIEVSKNAVRLKWFDAYTNRIFPIRIKTYQRFNLDTRIFLPGT